MSEASPTDTWKERMERAEKINHFAHAIATHIDLPTVVQEAISRTQELCEADGASLLLVDPITEELYFDAVAGDASPHIQTIRLRPGEGIAGTVAQTGTSMLVRDAKQNTFFSADCDTTTGFQTGSIIAVALIRAQKVLGVLEAVRRAGQPAFEDDHLKRLEDLAPHVTIAVHNAQMTSHLEGKVQERTALLSRAKAEWEKTFDALDEPIAIQDGFILKRVNRAYSKRVGLPYQKLLGKTCHSVFAQSSAPCMGCPLIESGPGDQNAEISTADGATFVVAAFTLPHPVPENIERSRVIRYRDITRERQMERRLRESERMASIGQLASGAAHEINNPLGFVISNLTQLKSSLRDWVQERSPPSDLVQDIEEMIEESLEGTGRVKDIVRSLRELSRLEVGQSELACVNASMTRALRSELSNESQHVNSELKATEKVSIPPLQLDHALSHILRNARQAVSENQKIEIKTRNGNQQVEIEIVDEGCGIPQEHLHRIFEPFFTTRGIGKGIGLGLTVAYGIITRHGGSLEVQSSVGLGSRFLIRLPAVSHPSASRTEVGEGVPASP